jgi:hypothetical protein
MLPKRAFPSPILGGSVSFQEEEIQMQFSTGSGQSRTVRPILERGQGAERARRLLGFSFGFAEYSRFGQSCLL